MCVTVIADQRWDVFETRCRKPSLEDPPTAFATLLADRVRLAVTNLQFSIQVCFSATIP